MDIWPVILLFLFFIAVVLKIEAIRSEFKLRSFKNQIQGNTVELSIRVTPFLNSSIDTEHELDYKAIDITVCREEWHAIPVMHEWH